MHTWYHAVCDECKEHCTVLVTSTFHIRPGYVTEPLEIEKKVVDFLSKHYSHNLRLIHRDEQLEEIWKEEYYDVYRDRSPNKKAVEWLNAQEPNNNNAKID